MLTPLDIESKDFSSSLSGYNKSDVNQFMKEILVSYERMNKENIEMKDKLNMLNDGIQYYKTIETTLQNTLLLAEKTSEEVKAAARSKAESIEKEAEINAARLMTEAKEEIYHINQMRESMVKAYDANKIQIKQFLMAQLEMITKSELELDAGTNLADEMLKRIKEISAPKTHLYPKDTSLDDTMIFKGVGDE
jgi:cell division initiation protein